MSYSEERETYQDLRELLRLLANKGPDFSLAFVQMLNVSELRVGFFLSRDRLGRLLDFFLQQDEYDRHISLPYRG